jgi:hypothetical protein
MLLGHDAVGWGIGARRRPRARTARRSHLGRDPRGPKKDQTERTRLDSPGQIGAPFSEGKRRVHLWSRVEADPALAASIPAASTLRSSAIPRGCWAFSLPSFPHVPSVCVRREGALDQRVEVPPEEEVDPLGSYLAGTRGDPRTRSPETEGLERRSSELAGRNVSEARAGPERAIVGADLTHIQGRLGTRREGRHQHRRVDHRGSGAWHVSTR